MFDTDLSIEFFKQQILLYNNNVIYVFEHWTMLQYIPITKRDRGKGEKVEVKSGENRPTPEVIELPHAFPILVINFWSFDGQKNSPTRFG